MGYEILTTTKGLSILHITEAHFNAFKGWRIEFHDGNDALLYNCCNEWAQYKGEWLDAPTIMAIGNCIDNSILKKKAGITDSYFYDMLIN